MSFRVDCISSVAELGRLMGEWRVLDQAQPLRLPFTGPDWNLCWWQHLAAEGSFVQDSLHVLTVRDEAGALVGLAPFMSTERPSVGPFRTRCLQFLGADPNVTEMRSALFAPGRERVVMDALLTHLEKTSDDWDWIQWTGVPEKLRAMLAIKGAQWTRPVPAYVLPLRPTWDELRAGLGRNLKESLRKCYNSLKRDNHTFTFEVASTAAEVNEGLGHFFRLHALRASRTDTIVHKDVFANPANQNFLREYCRRTSGEGARVFLLRIGGRVVAARVGFVLADTLYLYFSGYDPEWHRYSVMTTTVAESVKWAIEQKLRWVNLSFGTDVSKTRWDPIEYPFHDAVLVSSRVNGALKYRGYERLSGARESPLIRKMASWMLRGG